MNRKLTILTLIGLLLAPTILLAGITGTGSGVPEEPPAEPPIQSLEDIVAIMDKVGRWIFAIVFALAIVFILVSAFQFLTAAGNPEKITSARQTLIYALVAVAVAVVAWGLPALVKLLLGTTT